MRRAALLLLCLTACGEAPLAPVAQAPTPAPTAAPPRFDAATACGAPVLGRDDARRASCEAVHGGIGGEFTRDIERAQALIDATRPDLFFRDTVKDEADYTDALVLALGRAGLCALREEGDTLVVKSGQTFSEAYDVIAGDLTIRRTGSLTEKCRPSSW